MLKNGLYNAATGVVSLIVSLLTVPLLISRVGLENYGLWSLALAVIGIFTLAEGGLSVSTTVFLARDFEGNNLESASETLTFTASGVLLLASASSLLLWILAPVIVLLFPQLNLTQRSLVAQSLGIGALIIWGRLLQQLCVGVLQATKRYGSASAILSCQTIALNTGLLFVAWSGGVLIAMMSWYAFVSIMFLFVLVWRSAHELYPIKVHFMFDRSKCLAISKHSVAIWGVTIGSTLFTQVDRIVLAAFLGASSLGIYAAITSIVSKINALSGAAVQPLLPELSGLLVNSERTSNKLAHTAKQALVLNTVAAFVMGVVLFTATPYIAPLIIGNSDVSVMLALQLATIIYALYSPNAAGYYSLLTTSASSCLKIQLSISVLTLFLIGWGASTWGMLGAVIGNAGYTGVWLLTVVGMSRLGISQRVWFQWISIPFMWFGLAVVVITYLSVNGYRELTVLIAPMLVLVILVWWLRSQPRSASVSLFHMVARHPN